MTVASNTVSGKPERDIVIVGGGIAGLTVAWYLHRAGVDVTLAEARDKVGGAIETEHRDGFLLEKGPFNVMIRAKEFEELIDGLSDHISVVTASEEANNRYIYRRGAVRKVPTGPIKLLTTDLLSTAGALRAMRGLFLSPRGKRDDTTLEEFAVRRFGQEVADTLVSAAIAGILAGDIRKLSAYASFPVLEEFDRKSISPLGRTARRIPTMMRKKRDPKLRRRWKGLVSIDRGLGGMCDAIADVLGDRCITGCRVDDIRRDGDGFTLGTRQDGETGELRCRRLVLATPAKPAADLIEPLAAEASRLMNNIDGSSLTVINLGFRKSEVGHPLDGFGFLVPHNEPDFPLMGVLWADSAFPHHAPPEYRLLRCFFGGMRTPDVIERDSDALVRTACSTLREVLDVRGEPVLVDVCPYPEAIPQYYLGHREKVAEIRRHVSTVPDLTLAGNYLDGVSINDCVKLGKQVAEDLSGKKQNVTV